MVSTGLKDVGYEYVNLDDCWQNSRDTQGNILVDPKYFPSGIKALVDYAHSKGLKFGLYSDAGYKTCAGRPGSLGYEKQDAKSYASWGVDFLKYDNCNTDGSSPKVRYPPMRDALNATGKRIFYSMCEWGVEDPATWSESVANMWRTTNDIADKWEPIVGALDENDKWASYASPGAWNDPDMIQAGNGKMTTAEYRSQFSLWALVKAPLLITCDVTKMSKDTFTILTNEEIIALNQDPLGVQGKKRASLNHNEVWASPLYGKDVGAILFNRNTTPQNITANWFDLGLTASTAALVRDLWAHKNVGVFINSITALVQPHDVVVYRLTPTSIKK